MFRPTALLIALALCVPGLAGPDAEAARGGVIRKIEITGNRVREKVIRSELAFAEGDRISDAAVEQTRENLFKLGLFKVVEIEQAWDDELGGVKVTVRAKDAWYVLPWPMFGSRGGDTYAALLLTEANVLRHGESVTVWGSSAEGSWSGMGSVHLPRVYVAAGLQRSDRTEYLYADGAYNTKTFESDWETEEPEDFGSVADEYEKETESWHAGVGIPSVRDWKGYVGFASSEVTYGETRDAGREEGGRFNWAVCSVGYGKAIRSVGGYTGGGAMGFGRLFGMGMAGVAESLKPLPRRESTWGGELTVERGDERLGSDADFTRLKARLRRTTLFCNRSSFEVAAAGAGGHDLPESQRVATDRRSGLKGVYAREYRGDALAVLSAEYSCPALKSRVGGLTVREYVDYGVCRLEDEQWERQGIGAEVSYRFWRFPLPLGLGCTYSIDDRNWQYSMAVGGAF